MKEAMLLKTMKEIKIELLESPKNITGFQQWI